MTGEDGYRIYKGDGSTTSLYAQLGPNVTTYADTGLNCGSPYFYEVSAYNASGESDHTARLQADTQSCTDDPPPVDPTVSVNDVTVAEGTGGTSSAVFTVVLSAASTQTITVGYATENVTATAPDDYTAAAGADLPARNHERDDHGRRGYRHHPGARRDLRGQPQLTRERHPGRRPGHGDDR